MPVGATRTSSKRPSGKENRSQAGKVPRVPGYAAFLRGVNLGKVRRVGSGELREIFEGEGFSEVSTFRTSGNVVFAADAQPQKDLASRIERKLGDELGYEVAVFLRTAR
jgi:uncharacterized protein (DUF1697 family)